MTKDKKIRGKYKQYVYDSKISIPKSTKNDMLKNNNKCDNLTINHFLVTDYVNEDSFQTATRENNSELDQLPTNEIDSEVLIHTNVEVLIHNCFSLFFSFHLHDKSRSIGKELL